MCRQYYGHQLGGWGRLTSGQTQVSRAANYGFALLHNPEIQNCTLAQSLATGDGNSRPQWPFTARS